MSALDNLLKLQRSVTTNPTPLLEIIRHEHTESTFGLIGVINHSGQNGTAFHKPVPLNAIPLTFTTDKKIKSIRLLKAEKEIDYDVTGEGKIKCIVPEVERFEVLVYEMM